MQDRVISGAPHLNNRSGQDTVIQHDAPIDDAKKILRNAYVAISGQFFSMPYSSPVEIPRPYCRRMTA
jgi:hypothetical protein